MLYESLLPVKNKLILYRLYWIYYFFNLFFFKFLYFLYNYYIIIINCIKMHVILFVCFILVTLIIATVTLIERKCLSLVQRRVGPSEVAFRGRLQFFADALKLLAKGLILPYGVNPIFFLVCMLVAIWSVYIFWVTLPINDDIILINIEYNILVIAVFSIMFTYSIVLVGIFSKNKYSLLASIRGCLMVFNLEILIGIFIMYLLCISESLSINLLVNYQSKFHWNIFLILPICVFILIIFLLEVNRIPFDLTEAEAELVAGYTNELSGFFFVLFYLGEYFHLVFYSILYTIFLFGGWVS